LYDKFRNYDNNDLELLDRLLPKRLWKFKRSNRKVTIRTQYKLQTIISYSKCLFLITKIINIRFPLKFLARILFIYIFYL
jgi:hypothetical protein